MPVAPDVVVLRFTVVDFIDGFVVLDRLAKGAGAEVDVCFPKCEINNINDKLVISEQYAIESP